MLPRRRCSTLALGAVALALSAVVAMPAHAQSLGPRLEGLAPDAQVSGGLGLGLGASLPNPFLGRVRIGLLYAFEPWMVDFGASLEAGALARLGFGASAGLGNFDGWYSELGAARAEGDGWVTHVVLGYMVFGVEWQHRFDTRHEDALLAQLRVPLGLWWFVDHQRERQQRARKAMSATRVRPALNVRPDTDSVHAASEVVVSPEAQAASERVGQVRLQVDGPTDGLTAEIDGLAAPTLLLGYDGPLQPGDHELVLYAGTKAVARQRFVVEPGKLVRVSVAVQAPSTPTAP